MSLTLGAPYVGRIEIIFSGRTSQKKKRSRSRSPPVYNMINKSVDFNRLGDKVVSPGGLGHHHHLSLSSSQPPPSATIIITTTTNCHYHHHNHHHLSLLSSQQPPTVIIIITTTTICHYCHHNNHHLSGGGQAVSTRNPC